MKSFESGLEVLEAVKAKRRIAKLTKMQRDQAVDQALQAFKSGNREEALEAALQICRTNIPNSHTVGSLEQREAAVKAAFRSFE